MRGLELVAGALALICVISLWAVSLIGWRRTEPVRHGGQSGLPTPAGRTSRTTWLPGAAGALLVASGIGGVAAHPNAVSMVMIMAGLGVVVTGLGGRVVSVDASPKALVVRYAARPCFVMPWASCRSLSPPRWPLGGWRVAGAHGRMLMASDLLGEEGLLDVIVARADLRFRGGVWLAGSEPRAR